MLLIERPGCAMKEISRRLDRSRFVIFLRLYSLTLNPFVPGTFNSVVCYFHWVRYGSLWFHTFPSGSTKRCLVTSHNRTRWPVLVQISISWNTFPELRTRWEPYGIVASNCCIEYHRLHDVELHDRIMREITRCTPLHHRARFDFLRDHQDQNWVDWSLVLFTDEWWFTLYETCGANYVRRRLGEELLGQHVVTTVKYGAGSVIVGEPCLIEYAF
jgi:hypothetical protein